MFSAFSSGSKKLGDVYLTLRDFEPHKLHKSSFKILAAGDGEHLPTKIGKKMRTEGYVPKLPIILVPGT